MTKETMTKIWTWLAVLSLLVSVNAVLLDRGSPVTFNSDVEAKAGLEHGGPLPMGAVLCPLAILTAYVGLRYARAYGGSTFYERLPIAFGHDLDFTSPDARNYQRVWFALSWIGVLVACIHLFVRFWSYPPIDQATHAKVGFFSADIYSALDGNAYRYLGISYYPFWEPWLVILLFTLVCLAFLAQLLALCNARPKMLVR